MSGESLAQALRDRDHPFASSFRCSDVPPPFRSADRELATVAINVRLSKGSHLSGAKPSFRPEENNDLGSPVDVL